MKGYKAFEKGLVCRGKQYAENTVFEEEKAVICSSGMHFYENPLDTLDDYPLIDDNGNMTEFAEVEALDEAITDDGKKFCTKKMKVGAKLSVADFIKASFEVTKESIVKEANAKKKGKDNLAKVGGDSANLVGGDSAKLVGGKHSVLVAENGSTAKGKKGTLLVLVERKWENHEYAIKSFKAQIIDGETLKEDTPYKLENGEFVEVQK